MNILITGGCGFVGSSLCISIKNKFKEYKIIAFDNFYRKGSIINKKRLEKIGIKVIKGDIRFKKDLDKISNIDLLIDCAADPSVATGKKKNLRYLVETNLIGTLNSLEFSKKNKAKLIFLSSSRIYPFEDINKMKFKIKNDQYIPKENFKNCKKKAISEKFKTKGIKTFYGFTKYSSENLIEEYSYANNIDYIINRCGVIAGPWQWGKIDQGFIVYWMICYLFNMKLSYIGYGGSGYQCRDILDINDLSALINKQITNFSNFKNNIFNIGGGSSRILSLKNLTDQCNKLFGFKKKINSISKTRYGDIPYYVTDYSKIYNLCGWKPKKKLETTVFEIYKWVNDHKKTIKKQIEKI